MSARRGDTPLKISTVIGVAASVVLAVFINVIGARHFHRWDATTGGLYTLSDATLETLRGLEEPVVLHVLLPEGDPLRESVDQMLVAYRAASSRLDVRATDPDRSPAEYLAIQEKYGIADSRAEGKLVTDAAVVVARAGVPYVLTIDDLAEHDTADPERTRPRLEEALTSAIRRVLMVARPRVCFTEGNGERSIDVAGDDGLALLKQRLVRNNLDVSSVWSDGAEPPAPFEGCALVIVAGPTAPIPPAHLAHLTRHIEDGGNALLVIGPIPDDQEGGYVELGDGPLLALAGVRRESDFVFEVDPARRVSRGFGETFLPTVKEHPVTASVGRRGGDVVVTVASSLTDLGSGVTPQRLLETSPSAFGMKDFFTWAKEPGEPEKRPGDLEGPLAVAIATERPKAPGQERGARMVVVASTSVLAQANWQVPELAATASFVQGSIAWLASHRAFLDIPSKPTVMSSLDVTESDLGSLFRSSVLLLPAAAALGGLLVWLARRREPPRRGRPRPGQTRGEAP